MNDTDKAEINDINARGGVAVLAEYLDHEGFKCASVLIGMGRRESASNILEEIDRRGCRGHGGTYRSELYRAMIGAWAEGKDEAITRAMVRWITANGCEACALIALTDAACLACENCTANREAT